MPGLDGLPNVAEHLNADAMAVRVVIRDETRAIGSVPYRWLRSKKNSCGDSSDHRPTLAGVEQARRGTSHLKASAPKLKHGSMAARHWMILKRSRLSKLATALCSLASVNVPQRLLPKNSPKLFELQTCIRAKWLKSFGAP